MLMLCLLSYFCDYYAVPISIVEWVHFTNVHLWDDKWCWQNSVLLLGLESWKGWKWKKGICINLKWKKKVSVWVLGMQDNITLTHIFLIEGGILWDWLHPKVNLIIHLFHYLTYIFLSSLLLALYNFGLCCLKAESHWGSKKKNLSSFLPPLESRFSIDLSQVNCTSESKNWRYFGACEFNIMKNPQ